MRVALFHGPEQGIAIEHMADPEPGPEQALVKVFRCSICGSDLSTTSPGAAFSHPLGRIGHEWSGEIIEVGRRLETVKVGDRIAGVPVAACGGCHGCLGGNPFFCENGTSQLGGFGEYMLVSRAAFVSLPQSLSFSDGALIEPMACGLHALRMAKMGPGQRVLVIGAGSMALAATYWARELGAAKIVVLSRSARRRELAMKMGADVVLGMDEEGQARIVTELGGAPDVVAECVGKSGMLELAMQHLRPQGTVVSLGMCSQADPVVPFRCALKEVRLLFPVAYTLDEFIETAQAFDSGKVTPEIMVSDVIALEDLPGTLASLRSGEKKSLKIQVDPTAR